MLYTMLLSAPAYAIVVAPDAEAARARLRDETFDLALVDWDLPGMKGDTFCTLVKGQAAGTKTILFSNHLDVEDSARDCGADAWFRKSDDIFRLRQMIDDLLHPVA